MHYFEDTQSREKQLTRDFVDIHRRLLCDLLSLNQNDKIVVEFQKSKYGKNGDVDIAVWKNPEKIDEQFIAVEIKTLFLTESGKFKSEKLNKHHPQMVALEKEGWDLVYFFDFIVTQPARSWFHPQSFDGHENYRKTVPNEKHGHIVFQINSIVGRPESVSGSISHRVLNFAQSLPIKEGRALIKEAINSFDFSTSSVIIDI